MKFTVTMKDPDAVYDAILCASQCEVEDSGF